MKRNHNDDKRGNNAKKLKPVEEKIEKDNNQMAVVAIVPVGRDGDANDDSPPSIFKLDIDCCEELFEYLSIVDLHSLSQTCKRMHQFTGYFVRENYKSTEFLWNGENLSTYRHGCRSNMDGFIEFISNLSIESHRMGNFSLFAPRFKSIKRLKLHLNCDLIDCIKEILQKCEKIEISIDNNSFYGDLYEKVLKFCTNLKHLSVFVHDSGSASIEIDNNWLLHKYPNLEYVNMYSSSDRVEISSDHLKKFFALNEGIRNFQVNAKYLWNNRHWILNSNIKLAEISVECTHLYDFDSGRQEEFINLLNALYERDAYQRLSLKNLIFKRRILATIRAAHTFNVAFLQPLPPLNLKEINILLVKDTDGFETKFANNVSTIERIKIFRLFSNTSSKILFFIQNFKKLKEIKIINLDDKNSLDLAKLNKERERLVGTSRVTIYVRRWDYNPSMRMNNFKLVQIKCFD